MGYSFRLTPRVILYAPSHKQDSTYHGLCYTSRGALAGTWNSSMGPPHEGSIRRPIAPWANALTTKLHLAPHQLSCQKSYQSRRDVLDKSDIIFMTYQVIKCILSQSTDPFNGQTKYYLKIYTFNISQNLPYITIIFNLLTIYLLKQLN